jgi:hypothetical protein
MHKDQALFYKKSANDEKSKLVDVFLQEETHTDIWSANSYPALYLTSTTVTGKVVALHLCRVCETIKGEEGAIFN